MRLLLKNIRFDLQYTSFNDKIVTMEDVSSDKSKEDLPTTFINLVSMYLYCAGLCTFCFIEEDIVNKIIYICDEEFVF